MSVLARVLLLTAALATSGCAAYYWLGIQFLYHPAELPRSQISLDVPYDPSAPDDPRRQMDVFVPAGRDFPTVVFIHGGGWTWGSHRQRFGGADVYRNVGRFFATQGIGAANVGYRLLWGVDWRTQVEDVARAVAFVQREIVARGGRPGAIFLAGHSAGAQLATRLAVDPSWLTAAGGDPDRVCGVMAISGAGYDLADDETYRLGHEPQYFAERFGGSRPDGPWRQEASPIRFVDGSDPPFLVVYATGENAPLRRQSQVLYRRLVDEDVPAKLVVVQGSSHERIVLELSRPDKTTGRAMLDFIRSTTCS